MSPATARAFAKRVLQAASAGILTLCAAGLLLPAGCATPRVPSLTGEGKFHDLSQVRRGMSPNEVRRVMGNNYKTIWEEGLQGMDGGIQIWEYPEGRVYYNQDGAFKVVPFK